MMTKLLFLIINDLSKSNKKDQISSPVLYHAEKATEVFQSNNITRTRTWRKKLFESFKAKEESSPPHAIHFEALTYTQHIYKNNNNCSSSKHTQRKIARKKEQRPKSRGDRNKKERKRKKTDQHSDTTVPWHTNSEHTTTKRDHEAQTAK